MKKKMFGANFAPTQQPGFQTRFKSMEGLMGVTLNNTPEEKDGSDVIFRESGLREKFKSLQVPETLPSRKLRKWGL